MQNKRCALSAIELRNNKRAAVLPLYFKGIAAASFLRAAGGD